MGGFWFVVAPFTADPIAVGVGGFVPWVLMWIIGIPTMPMAAVYLFVWQWVQIFARAIQTWVDGEPLSAGLFGANIVRAYWYMYISLIMMAVVYRFVLKSLKLPTQADRTAHLRWQPRDLLMVYLGGLGVSTVAFVGMAAMPSLNQPIGAFGQVKIIGIFLLAGYVISTGQGGKFLLGAVLFEIGSGFTGLFSDFRGVFIFLAIAAMAARVRVTGKVATLMVVGLVALVTLALWWTSVKSDFRQFAAQSDTSQEIKTSLGDRMSYLGGKVSQKINLDQTAYLLLSRLAYVDIFGSVIDVQEAAPEPMPMRQWREAVGHVTVPRFLDPSKAPLSDSEVFQRLTQRYMTDEIREGTSISVGYMGENFADLGFPGMLAGIGVLALMEAMLIRYLMNFQLPLIVREGIVMGFAFSMSRDGVEVSLAKVLGASIMFGIAFTLMNKFVFPKVMAWLDRRAALAARQRHS